MTESWTSSRNSKHSISPLSYPATCIYEQLPYPAIKSAQYLQVASDTVGWGAADDLTASSFFPLPPANLEARDATIIITMRRITPTRIPMRQIFFCKRQQASTHYGSIVSEKGQWVSERGQWVSVMWVVCQAVGDISNDQRQPIQTHWSCVMKLSSHVDTLEVVYHHFPMIICSHMGEHNSVRDW